MNLVLLGPPGAGKGTQATTLIERLQLPLISTGDTIRAAIRGGTELGAEASRYTHAGRLVPDRLVIGMVVERLSRDDCRDGFLLDGFPRTVAQAEALDDFLGRDGRRLDHVLLIDVADDDLVTRITGRRCDPETGAVYHLEFHPPPREIADRLIQREDDTAEVLQERLRAYRDQTAPLIPYYERAGLLRRIAGSGSREDVRERILDAVGLTRTIHEGSS